MQESDSGELFKQAPLRVTVISIVGLFGRLDHRVNLRSVPRVTVILGPNGAGKTNLLECVAALLAGRLDRLARVPFKSLKVDFDDTSSIRVTQVHSEPDERQTQLEFQRFIKRKRKVPRAVDLLIELLRENTVAEHSLVTSDSRVRKRHEVPPWIERVGPSMFVDTRTGRRLSPSEFDHLYGHDEPLSPDVPAWLKAVRARVSVHLIETQRLLRTPRAPRRAAEAGSPVRLAVSEVAEHIQKGMHTARDSYTRQAAVLDRTYVGRFLAYHVPDEALTSQLQRGLESIADRQARLELLGVLAAERGNKEVMALVGVSNEKRLALALYVDDMDRKLKVLEPYAKKLQFLTDKINRKLRGKSVVASYDDGLHLESTAAPDDDAQLLDLEQLSSGEQHELVLLHKLVFEVEPNALVLIDEPELSLHPLWQEQLIEDLLQIAVAQGFDMLLATHSPYIVGHRVELCETLSDES